MTYATRQDLIARYGEPELIQLTDRAEETTDVTDDAMIGVALEEADAEINSYLARRVATPIDPVPAHVRRIAADIARYRLWKDHAPDYVVRGYTDAVAWLKRAAAGDVALGDSETATTTPSSGIVQTSAPDRVFSRDSMKGF